MTKPYVMRQAGESDLELVASILEERIAWLKARGSDQWNTGRSFRNRITNSIARGETWLLEDNGAAIATVTVSADGDPDFWTPVELAERALYITKMASTVSRNGEGLGELIIRWTQDRAEYSGASLVRWDVWRTNVQLQAYYQQLGAKMLRTVEVADRWSGTLFQMSAKSIPDLAADVVTQHA